jgi:hypothetical protein
MPTYTFTTQTKPTYNEALDKGLLCDVE